MKDYKYIVTVGAESREQADIVMRERIGYDEDLSEYGVEDYIIGCEPLVDLQARL
jgi:5-formaminoimidazole-4-carboxamide-1-beta-D-ribofuranosyl 5'-monophosphate synthetase